jgi:RNA polymerase sigma factor (sigma-70 family)
MIPTEGQLVDAACKGDRAAMERLLAMSQPDLRRFARRSCASSEDADDAVQVALWNLQRNIGSIKVISALASWMFRIVERECYRLLRLTRRTDALTDEMCEVLEQKASPDLLRRDLANALATLPDEYREVLILRDVDEFTAPEVAERLQLSVAAVKSRLHRARGMMRERLQADGYTPMQLDEQYQSDRPHPPVPIGLASPASDAPQDVGLVIACRAQHFQHGIGASREADDFGLFVFDIVVIVTTVCLDVLLHLVGGLVLAAFLDLVFQQLDSTASLGSGNDADLRLLVEEFQDALGMLLIHHHVRIGFAFKGD